MWQRPILTAAAPNEPCNGRWTMRELIPLRSNYINAHGSSTQANDAIETAAVKHVFGEDAYHIPVTSTKSMIGHAMAGCGSLEIAACLMTLERELLHPTVNYERPDPACNLDYVPNVRRGRSAGIRTVMSNSFGLGGQNASIILRKNIALREFE